MRFHEHTCRDCGEGFECNGRVTADGCMDFDGSCAKCHHFTCDMHEECNLPTTYIDESGFIYCTGHGLARQSWKLCRKMRPHELRRIERGQQIDHY